MLFDGRNAFACSRVDRLVSQSHRWLGRDSMYVADLMRYGEATVKAMDGDLLVRPGSGMMGHVLAPKLFVLDFCAAVAEWNNETMRRGKMMLVCDSITGSYTVLSLGVFVDDIQKLLVAAPLESHEQLVMRSTEVGESLERYLDDGGYVLNRDKSVLVLGLRGRGSMTAVRQVMRGRTAGYGRRARVARYLGPEVALHGLVHLEVQRRVAAARRGWAYGGKVWFMRRVPFRLVRMLFIGLVQNALLSAMTVMMMDEASLSLFDKILVK